MLKSDLDIFRTKNEEYIIKLSDMNSLYQEVCDRNQMLEKLSKQAKVGNEEDYASSKNHLANFLTSGSAIHDEESKETSGPELFTVNMKFNINKINKKEKKLSQFLNNNSKKQVVTKELEIDENTDENTKEDAENAEKESENMRNKYHNPSNVLITNSSFVSDYNSENFYMETNNDNYQSEEQLKTSASNKRNTNETSLKKLMVSSTRAIKARNYNGNTNNTHNSNNSMSVYESHYDSKLNNDEYNSNAYECLKNIENFSSNAGTNPVNNQNPKAVQVQKRRYEYDTNCFKDDEDD